MKADPEVKMISAEAPILFAKGCDIFITELTMRAWIHAEENKRRTLQRSDIASALAKSDMFDFLIDIVPREDATPQHKRRPEYTPVGTYQIPGGDPSSAGAPSNPAAMQEHGQPSMGGQEFAGIEQAHMQGQPTYQQQTGMYPPPAPQQAQYAGQPMFDPSMYAQPQPGYGMGGMQPMQQVSQLLLTVEMHEWTTADRSPNRCTPLDRHHSNHNLNSKHNPCNHIVLQNQWMSTTLQAMMIITVLVSIQTVQSHPLSKRR